MDLPVISLNTENNEIESILRARGIYPTSQRLASANALFIKHQHVTAEQLHEALCQAGFQLSKATVYNTLGLFVKRRLLREIHIDANRTFYDSNTSHHHHYYNVETGDLIDITKSLSLHIDDENLPYGTSVESIDIVIRVRNKAG